ncbi:hypothetical protein FACS189472_10610 [Alphaproteobacteria bacterium]|nr:hypothetical protein FACS189472_10610 [Alphaproteobacteria bacterium]
MIKCSAIVIVCKIITFSFFFFFVTENEANILSVVATDVPNFTNKLSEVVAIPFAVLKVLVVFVFGSIQMGLKYVGIALAV